MHTIVHSGILLPQSVLYSAWFGILTAFVAVNTVMYLALAILKLLPPMHPSGWFRRGNTRSETRHIDPNAPIGGPQPRAPRRRRSSRG